MKICGNTDLYFDQKSNMSRMSMVLWMVSLSTIFDFHHSSTITTISMVDHMLDSTIRKSNCVLAFHISSLITSSLFTEICVVLVIMHTILKMERIRVFIVSTMTSLTPVTNNTIRSRMAKYLDRE